MLQQISGSGDTCSVTVGLVCLCVRIEPKACQPFSAHTLHRANSEAARHEAWLRQLALELQTRKQHFQPAQHYHP